jgi:RNA polymerase sigma-70 factor (ECF subfamily)
MNDDATTSDADADLPTASTTPSRLAMYREQAEVMRLALEGLPQEFREVVWLRVFEQTSLEDIAQRLSLSVSAVRHRFRKGSELYTGRLRVAFGLPPLARESVADSSLESSP